MANLLLWVMPMTTVIYYESWESLSLVMTNPKPTKRGATNGILSQILLSLSVHAANGNNLALMQDVLVVFVVRHSSKYIESSIPSEIEKEA
jgi:hypothetical protein